MMIRSHRGVLALLVAAAMVLPPAALFGTGARSGQKKSGQRAETSRLRIEVTGGDEKKPVADASVYLKFVKGKNIELNLKTNQEGVARSPEIPQGKVLLQIVVPGWKTFGQWYDVDQDEQTIPIHLERPATKWY